MKIHIVKIGWIVVVIFTSTTLIYFLANVGSQSFRDAALGNLFATILGVIIGVPIAIELSRWQEQERLDRAKNEQAQADLLRIRALFYRVRDELRDNGHTLARVRSAIDESSKSRSDHWEWVLSICQGLKFDAYNEFSSKPLQPPFPWELDDSIKLATSMLLGTQRRANEAAAAHVFYLGSRGDTENADKYLGFVRDLAREASRRVEEANSVFDRYTRLYPRP